MSNVRISSGLVTNVPVNAAEIFTISAPTIGNAVYKDSPYTSFQAVVQGTGVVTATVVIECSNDNLFWCTTPLGTITLTGTTNSSDGFTSVAPWKYVRAKVTAISGTSASVSVTAGV